MGTIDFIALWIGRGILVACAFGGAAILVAGLNAAIGMIFWAYARKIGFSARNFQAVHAWVENGRPRWEMGNDKVYRMVPSPKKEGSADA